MVRGIRQHKHELALFLIFAAVFMYLAHINSYHLVDPDEGRYHRVAMEMALSGDWITPQLDGMPYFEKPVLQYWVTALTMKIFGVHDFAGRVLPALSGLGSVFLAYVLGKRMYNRRTGLLAAVILGTTALNLIVASIGIVDMALTFFVDACFVAFYFFERTEKKKYLLWFYVAMALGMLTKGLIAIVFPFGIIFIYALLTRRPSLFKKLFYLPGILLFLVIALPWYILVSLKNPDFFYFFFICQHFLRFTTKMYNRFHPWYYFVPVLLAGFMPWTGFLLTFFSKHGIIRHPGTLRHKADMIFLVLWAGLIYLFFSVSDSKLPTYILPCWLPLSVLLAASLERCRQLQTWLCHSFAVNVTLCLLFTLAGVGFLMFTNYISIIDFLLHSVWLAGSLLIGTMAILWSWHHKRSFASVFLISSFMAYGFGLGVHQVQGEIHNNRSMYAVSETIEKLPVNKDTSIMMYGRFMPGLMYYLNRPIATVNTRGELDFGLNHTDKTNMYYDDATMAEAWQSTKQELIVVPTKSANDVVQKLSTPPAQRIDMENYVLLLNHTNANVTSKNEEYQLAALQKK